MDHPHYRPEIDGLRALAVAAVVLYHIGLDVPGGFIGVDIFFVISGFLITGIIRRRIEQSTFSLSEFWERRIRRIFPALFGMVLGTLGLGYCLLLPQELAELGESAIAQSLLLANVYFWRDTGYFAAPAELKPLMHTWSLAVEEQFYLLFPLVLLLVRSQSRWRLFIGMAAVSVISLAISIYGTIVYPDATFFLLPTRAWELLTGCMLAVVPWKSGSKPKRDTAIAVTGLIAILVPMFVYDSETPFPGLAALPPVLGAAAVIYGTTLTRGTQVERVLSLRPVVFVGLISYSLYLWHWPVIVFVRSYYGYLGWKQAILAFVCSVLLAVVSWRFIERPFRQKTVLRRRPRLLGAACAGSLALVAFSFLLVGSGGIPARFPGYSPTLLDDTTWTGDEYAIALDDEFDFDKLPRLGAERRQSGVDRMRPDFILWGDSHGRTFCHLIDEVAKELNLSGKAVVTSNVPSVPNVCMPNNEFVPARDLLARQRAVMEMLATHRPRHLLLVSRWSWYTDGASEIEPDYQEARHLLSDDQLNLTISEPPEEVLQRNLEELIKFCDQNGIKLWVVKQVPETGELSPARELFLFSVERRKQLSDLCYERADHQARQAKAEAIFARRCFAEVSFLDPASVLLGKDGKTINYLDGRSLYRDNDHLTKWGLEQLRPLVREAMSDMTRNQDDRFGFDSDGRLR